MQVLDLSVDVAGGFCSKLLALEGARVLRGGPVGTEWISRYLHAHKEVIGLPGGPGLLDLAGTCDVVVASFEAGRLRGRAAELDAAELERVHPGVVQLVTSSFGTDGPYAGYHAHPLVDWAAGGYLFITGDPDRPPLAGPQQLCGYVAGYTAAVAVQAALARRRTTGRGGRLDISTMESMLSMHQSTFSRLGAGILRTRTGRYTEVFPLVVLPCRDGHVSIGVVTDDEFDRLTLAMGRPELPLDPRFASSAQRTGHRDELEPILRRWLAPQTAADVVALLHAHGLASAKVASPAELLENEQLEARGYWDRTTVGGREVKMPGNPLGPRPERTGPPASAGGPAPADPKLHPPSSLPLATPRPLRVLDLTAFWAGPSATRNLADLGADVVRIERPGSRLDFAAAEEGDPVQALFDHKTNRHKRSVVLDLRHPAGRNVFLELVERADVVVENYRAGVMDSLGLGHRVLAEKNPSLVHVALSGFGSRGPWAAHKSYGPTIEAASSIEFRTRYRGSDEPLRLGHTLPDGVGGLVGTYAALVGLRRRAETGSGCYLDVSQLEAYCALSGEELLAHAAGAGPDRGPDEGDAVDPEPGVYPCRGEDEWVVIAPRSRVESEAARALLGDPGQGTPRTAAHDKVALSAALQRLGVPAFAVLRADELVADPQLVARRYFVPVRFGDRTVALPGSALRGRPELVDPHGLPPAFGADTAAVLHHDLGLSATVLEKLAADGAIFCRRAARDPDAPSEPPA